MQKCILCYSPIFKKDKKQFPYAFSLTYSRAQQEQKQKKITFKYRTGVVSRGVGQIADFGETIRK